MPIARRYTARLHARTANRSGKTISARPLPNAGSTRRRAGGTTRTTPEPGLASNEHPQLQEGALTPVLVFDIETVPDIAGLRKIYGTDSSVSDGQMAAMAFQRRRQASGNEFLQLHLQQVVAISCALRDGDSFRVWSLGGADDSEA